MEFLKKLLLVVALVAQTATFTWGEHTEHALDRVSGIVHGDRGYRGDRYGYDRGYYGRPYSRYDY